MSVFFFQTFGLIDHGDGNFVHFSTNIVRKPGNFLGRFEDEPLISDAQLLVSDAHSLGSDAQTLVSDADLLGSDAQWLVSDAQSLGVRNQPIGVISFFGTKTIFVLPPVAKCGRAETSSWSVAKTVTVM
jgi:hypothetical protein